MTRHSSSARSAMFIVTMTRNTNPSSVGAAYLSGVAQIFNLPTFAGPKKSREVVALADSKSAIQQIESLRYFRLPNHTKYLLGFGIWS